MVNTLVIVPRRNTSRDINPKGHRSNVVPSRLDPNKETDWSPVWPLTRDRHLYLPATPLYYGKVADR